MPGQTAGSERFLLLDEPTSSLDPAHQHTAMRLIRRVADDGRGVLAVLHDLNLAAAYADRVVLMHDARVVESGHAGGGAARGHPRGGLRHPHARHPAPAAVAPAGHRRAARRLTGRAANARIMAEVAKCDIVCANCHRDRTYRRRDTNSSERE